MSQAPAHGLQINQKHAKGSPSQKWSPVVRPMCRWRSQWDAGRYGISLYLHHCTPQSQVFFGSIFVKNTLLTSKILLVYVRWILQTSSIQSRFLEENSAVSIKHGRKYMQQISMIPMIPMCFATLPRWTRVFWCERGLVGIEGCSQCQVGIGRCRGAKKVYRNLLVESLHRKEAAEQYTIALLRLKACMKMLQNLGRFRYRFVRPFEVHQSDVVILNTSWWVWKFEHILISCEFDSLQEVAQEVQAAESQTLKALLLANRAQAHLTLQHWEPWLYTDALRLADFFELCVWSRNDVNLLEFM